jgi:FkbM family methyltransferase
MRRVFRFLIWGLKKYQSYAEKQHQKPGELEGALQQLVLAQKQSVQKDSAVLFFCRTNELTAWRASTFFEKEPETLAWLDGIPLGSCLWDIGANVGLYSVYAAKIRKCRVYAFEPSVFNLELLARNLHLNNLSSSVTIIPVALSNTSREGAFELSSLEQGGACSTFYEGYDQFGKPMQTVFTYRTLSISGDDLLSLYAMQAPDYIKIDVDGIEHVILSGMTRVLAASQLKSVLVETNFDFLEQADRITVLMEGTGFSLIQRAHAECFDDSRFSNTYNCIWSRQSVLRPPRIFPGHPAGGGV